MALLLELPGAATRISLGRLISSGQLDHLQVVGSTQTEVGGLREASVVIGIACVSNTQGQGAGVVHRIDQGY